MPKQRIDNDFYETPPALTEQLLDFCKKKSIITPQISESIGDVILEPCNGDGSISKIFLEKNYTVITNDKDTSKIANYHDDAKFLTLFSSRRIMFDWAITNPPFNQSAEILNCCLQNARVGAIFLLRLSFLEPANKGNGRRELLLKYADNLRYLIPVNPRPQFREDTKGTDSVTVAWFIFDKCFSWEKAGLLCPFQFIVDWR